MNKFVERLILGKDAELSAPHSNFFLRGSPYFVFVAQTRFRTFVILPVSARKTKHATKLAAKNFGQKAVAVLRAPCLPPNIDACSKINEFRRPSTVKILTQAN